MNKTANIGSGGQQIKIPTTILTVLMGMYCSHSLIGLTCKGLETLSPVHGMWPERFLFLFLLKCQII